jgi:hypothetical protein
MLEPGVLATLLRIGKDLSLGGTYRFADIDSLKSYDAINRLAPSVWRDISEALQNDDLLYLLKALTIVERDLRWTGGSVAAAIWVFRELESRVPEENSTELADWILASTLNPYLPFGRHNHGAHSVVELRSIDKWRRERIRQGSEHENESTEAAKLERKTRAVQRSTSHALRNTEERRKILAELQTLPLENRLKVIADDERFAVNFYPTSWAESATSEFLSSLDRDLQIALAKKLKGKHRGPWGAFKKRLLANTGIPWNRPKWFS